MRLIGVILVSLLLVYTWSHTFIKSFDQVKQSHRPSDVWLVDKNNLMLESVRQSQNNRSLEWVSLVDVSPTFVKLLILGEDHRFYQHIGVDVLSLVHSLYDGLHRGQSFRGASTLSMQLSSLMKSNDFTQRKSLWQKFKQIFSALKLESEWNKQEILEAYLNLVPFRGELVGLRAASLGYFNKNPSGLNEYESALLVSLLRSPNAAPALVSKRSCNLLKILNINDCTLVTHLAQDRLSKPYQLTRSRELVPVISDKFIVNDDPQNPNTTNLIKQKSIIKTTLDRRIQSLSINALKQQIQLLKSQNVHDGAVLVLDATTGAALAYVANGGPGYTSALQIDGIQSLRQVGSTIKPFVYATAFDLKLLKPNSLLEDSPADISLSGGRVYHPRNYDQLFRGFVGVGEALASSLNVPAVRVLGLTGEARVLDHLRNLGFSHLQQDDYYGPSLALGAIDASLWELTHGYRKLFSDQSPFSSNTRDILYNILAAPEYRRYTFGMESVLALPFPAVVKTGTSKDMRDNWCIGGTSQYIVGVWVGNFKGDPMWNVSGISGSAPVWREVMIALHDQLQSTPTTHYIPPEEPLAKRTLSRIRYPAPGMLVGLDPDIPQSIQKIPIEIENPQPNQNVFINNHLLGTAKDTIVAPLKLGRFKVQLKNSNNEVVDEVTFLVR